MPYKVQFVGLVCFYREAGARQALFPDGRDPGGGIAPHYPKLIVDPEAVQSAVGWSEDEQTQRGIYALPECDLTLEAADVAGTLDTSQHDGLLPQLQRIDPNFEIDPETAQAVVRLRLRNGALSAHTVPGGSAIVSQMLVPHDGAITIDVKPRDGSAPRSLRLAPATEIVLGNMAEHGIYDRTLADDDRHFLIYEKLSSRPVTLREPNDVAAVDTLDSRHWMFVAAAPINLSISCSNTGCCSG
ncbi:MAG: hypothetical protein QOI58_1663 [Thermoanaerobaculia bacterium]|jgi:hypothetical protein|nr:hypothetical protein [Thermoanaerobaculia bacterium]